MTAIGVLNIVFGAIGALFAILIVLGGGMIAAMGAGMEAEYGAEFEGAAASGAGLGGIMILVCVFALLVSGTMCFSGIGVLGVKPWGRKLSIICGGGLVVLNVASIFLGGFGLMNFVWIGYGCMLVGVFMRPDWKAAFSGQPVAIEGIQASDEFQQAA